MPYDLTNLIRYDDTIRLHFDTAGKTAWLILKNYGWVFGMEPVYAVWVVTVGVAATESGALPEAPADQKALVALGMRPGEFKPYPDSISIGEMLDAIDVIKLQVAILNITSTYVEKVLPRRAANAIISDALGTLAKRNFAMLFSEGDKNFLETTKSKLHRLLNLSPGDPSIAKNIVDYGEKKSNLEKEVPEKEEAPEVGFTAYFPKANLILQEQRTRLVAGGTGKTANHDPRNIEPIPSGMPDPTQIITPLRRRPEWEFQWIVDELDKGIRGKKSDEEVKGKLHGQIQRISCFALRGDDRNPVEHRKYKGFLPGLTRNDAGVDKFLRQRLELNRSLKPQPGWVDDPETKQTLHPLYLEVLRRCNLFHLGKFTRDADFKGFISTTKSAAIAKHFANEYAEEIECQTYCYAVRCRGGFHLNSYSPEIKPKEAKADIKKLHTFNNFAEQEIAVAGAIWWEHIVGMRVLKCNANGQFFSGPIFMKNDLIWEDSFAFGALFELLSGKSQGEAEENIFKSYEVPPFQYAEAGTANRGANSVSRASTTSVALVRVTPTQLTFERQPAGTRGAAQTVKLTNPGPGPIYVTFAMIVNDKGGNFKASISKDFNDPALELGRGEEFVVPVHFEPKIAGDSIGTLLILTKTSSNDPGPGTRYEISLAGTAVPKPTALLVSPESLAFGNVAKGTSSATQIVALTNRSDEVIRIGNIRPYGFFSADISEAQLRPHESRAINVTFDAPPSLGAQFGRLEVWRDGEAAPMVVSLTGTSAAPNISLALTPLSLNFEQCIVGTRSDFQHVTLNNTGNAVVTIENVEVIPKGDFEWEPVDDATPELRAGESRKVRVHFTPKNVGKRTAQLTATYKTGYGSQAVALEGFGVSKVIVSESHHIQFRNQKVGNREVIPVKLANPGDFPLSIGDLKIHCQKKNEFHADFPDRFVLEAYETCTIDVTFSPKAGGARKGTLSISYKVAGRKKPVTEEIDLIGTGEL